MCWQHFAPAPRKALIEMQAALPLPDNVCDNASTGHEMSNRASWLGGFKSVSRRVAQKLDSLSSDNADRASQISMRFLQTLPVRKSEALIQQPAEM